MGFFAVKRYEGRCPICGAKTYADSPFMSVPLMVEDKDEKGAYYPGLPCPNTHMANEMRAILGIKPLEVDGVLLGFGFLKDAPTEPVDGSHHWGKKDSKGNIIGSKEARG